MILKLNKKNKEWLPIIGLIVLAIVTHIVWLDPNSILTNTDWSHFPIEVVKNLNQGWGTWTDTDGFGGVNVQLPFYGFMLVWSILGQLGLDYDAVTKITIFIPITFLGFLSPYFLIRYLTRNNAAAFVSAIVYGSTTYGVANQPPIHFVYAFAPLLILAFIYAIERQRVTYWILFSLAFTIAVIYEVRITYILVFVILFYALTNKFKNIIGLKKNIFICCVSILLLNCFWLLPTIFASSASESISAIANRGLFGSSLFDLSHSLTVSNWFWTGGVPNDTFIKQPVLLHLWILPIAAFSLTLLAIIKKKFDKRWLFFISIALLGIFLSKQIDQPLTFVYSWLYSHFPGFNLFREASKFYLLTCIGYLGLIGLGIDLFIKEFNKRKKVYVIALASVITITSLINFLPVINGQIGGLFVSREIPNDYKTLNEFLSKTGDGSKTFWLPTASRWGYYSNDLPKATAGVGGNEWKNYINDSSISKSQYVSSNEIAQIFHKSTSQALFEVSGFKYLIIPLRDTKNDDDFYTFYGDDRNYYINLVNSIDWLKEINIGTREIKIYENEKYEPRFSASNTVINIDNFEDVNQNYSFTNSRLGKGLDFVSKSDKGLQNTLAPTTYAGDVFSDLANDVVPGQGIKTKRELNKDNNNSIYIANPKPSYSYNVESNQLIFNSSYESSVSVNGEKHDSDISTQNINLNHNQKYTLSVGKKVYDINRNSSAIRDIGQTTESVKLYSSNIDNLINNGSFESGLWSPKVEDCNAYDKKPIIGQSIDKEEKIDGNNSLRLGSAKHTACVSSNKINIKENTVYKLHYSYLIQKGQRAGYDLVFDDAKHTVISDDQINSTKKWYQMNALFSPPVGSHTVTLRLKGYPDDLNINYAMTNYDDIKIMLLNEEADLSKNYDASYQKLDLSNKASLDISAAGSGYDYNNLIINPSLENGLWQKKVGDCNNYDKNPIIGMQTSTQASDGKKSLELSATKHVACTGPNSIAVQEGSTYLLKFDYKGENAKQAGYYIGFNDDAGTSVSERIDIQDNTWRQYSKTISIPYGATRMTLSVYSYADDYSAMKRINYYDNFSLIRIPSVINNYYLVSEPKQQLTVPKNISFDLDTPTKKRVHINSATTGFYLNLNEDYNKGWRLELNDKNIKGLSSLLPTAKVNGVSNENHFNLNGFLNTWYVDPEVLCQNSSTACTKNANGSYDLELVAEFVPQRYFYVGLIVSGITAAGCAIYLSHKLYRKYRPRNKIYRIQRNDE